MRRFAGGAVAALVAGLLLAAPAGAPSGLLGAGVQHPGSGRVRGLPPTQYSTDQGMLYNALTPLQGNVTPADLSKYYLSEKFGVQGPVVRSENTGRARAADPA